MLENIPRLVSNYYTHRPDPAAPGEQVSFGTSGHRGTSGANTFNEDHILAIAQAICDYRQSVGITGPLMLGMDTHALSEPAFFSAIEVFVANEVDVFIQSGFGYTPTPVISHAILAHNLNDVSVRADGVVITPSHNPPSDGGFKYNPPSGGPADTDTTQIIQSRANMILARSLNAVKRVPLTTALGSERVHEHDFMRPYVVDLAKVVDMAAIARSGLKIGVDPMGGAGIHYWGPIAEEYGLDLTVVNERIDPAFSFMSVDKDGKIRMDCSSPFAMAGLIAMGNDFDIAFGNDPDYDRHGIVTRSSGLMNPNHYLAVAIDYLFRHRPGWRANVAVGKTLVSSSMIDRVAAGLQRRLVEVPVGFKWFVEGLITGTLGFGGEESAGASFLRQDGTVWTTDKDGIIMDLLAAEITAVGGRDPGDYYRELTAQYGEPIYRRIDAPANRAQKAVLSALSARDIVVDALAGDPITATLTTAPGNDAAIGGLKLVTANGWFAARPSGTEDVYKIYAESFRGEQHLSQIIEEAQVVVSLAFEKAGV